MSVLIVDDNATNRQILEEWLRGWQMKPVVRGDGLAALDAIWHGAASGRPFPLVLLDARMPDTDGLTLAATIRERAELAATRIILLTSGDFSGDLARFRELGIDAHLLKPVQQDELLETIYRVMSRAKGSAPTPIELAPGPEAASAAPATTSSLHILVAEDNEFNAQLLEQLLRPARPPRPGRQQWPGSAGPGPRSSLRSAAIGRPHAGTGRLPGRQRGPRARADVGWTSTRHRLDGAIEKRRPPAVPGGRHGRIPVQAGSAPPTCGRRSTGSSRADRPPREWNRACSTRGYYGTSAGVMPASWTGSAGLFRPTCRTIWRPCKIALEQRDTPRLREAAHKLSGMLAAFSDVAASVASDLEDHAAPGQLEEARPLVQQLETMVHELTRLVGRPVARDPATPGRGCR